MNGERTVKIAKEKKCFVEHGRLVDFARMIEQCAQLLYEHVKLVASFFLVLIARATFVVKRIGRRGRERVHQRVGAAAVGRASAVVDVEITLAFFASTLEKKLNQIIYYNFHSFF